MNVKNKEGKTPLMYAAANGYVACVNLLTQQGADVKIVDKTVQHSLDVCCERR